jgi:hypothetical protein
MHLNVSPEAYDDIKNKGGSIFFAQQPHPDITHIVANAPNMGKLAITVVQVENGKWQMFKYSDAA